MSTRKEIAPELRQQHEGEHYESDLQEGVEAMTTLIDAENRHERLEASVVVDARLIGGSICLDVEHVDWLGYNVVKVDLPGTDLALRPHEARDLAEALMVLAARADAEPDREVVVSRWAGDVLELLTVLRSEECRKRALGALLEVVSEAGAGDASDGSEEVRHAASED